MWINNKPRQIVGILKKATVIPNDVLESKYCRPILRRKDHQPTMRLYRRLKSFKYYNNMLKLSLVP